MKLKTLCLSVCLLFCCSLYAAEQETTAEEPPETGNVVNAESSEDAGGARDDESPADPAEQNKVISDSEDPGKADDEDFVPSIQVSEDLPVAFPTDI